MAEIYSDCRIKTIAFYLPQFHAIPENDKWWGKGFTEWTNVKKAVPLFEGHDQPKVPLHNVYYDLLDDEVKIWQADLAKKYGIFGFCYYHYWFHKGKMLLEQPAEQMLANTKIDMPFCFSWANENWSRNWDGGNHEILMKQEYGGRKDWEKHFMYLLPFFRDERYITIKGKPLFIIYKPEQIIDILPMMKYFRKRAKEEGFPGLCLAFQFPTYYSDMYYRDDIFDFRIAFEPVYSRSEKVNGHLKIDKRVQIIRRLTGEGILSFYRKKRQKRTVPTWRKPARLTHLSYEEAWQKILKQTWLEDLMPGAFVDWDNTPRNRYGIEYDGFTIERFREYFERLVARAHREKKPMIFINAWNEWGEGAFLEPDEKYGYRKLEAIRDALKQYNN